MTNAQCVLIDLLRKSLFNFDINIPEDTDWQAVYDEANFQAVIPLAFDGTAGIKGISKDIYKKFKNHTVAVMLNNDKVIKGQWELTDLLEKNNVKYAILKGLSVARYYPKPELRTLGDVDFLVSKDDFDSTKQLLIDNGYDLIKEEMNHFHCAFKKNDVIFELHFEMSEFPNTELCNNLRKELEKATKCTDTAVCLNNEFSALDELFQAVSLLLHTERHISKDGIGLRQLIDFGMFIDASPNFLINQKNIDFLKNYGLYKLTTVCNCLIDKYFLEKETENATSDMLFEMSLKKGNFGVKNDADELLGSRVLSDRNGINKFFIIRYFRFAKKHAKSTWELSKKYNWLSNFGFVYLPIRCFLKIFKGKRKAMDLGKVLNSSKENNKLYSELLMFKSNK